jgi:hypothetical protein
MEARSEGDSTRREEPLPLSAPAQESQGPSVVSDDRAMFEQLLNDFQAKGAASQPGQQPGPEGQARHRPAGPSRPPRG